MTPQELLFFKAMPQALPLYAGLSEKLLSAFPGTSVQVKKTQITFHHRHGYAFVSLRRMRGCPKVFIILSFGLSYRLDSPRIHMAVEPYPHRWTHHMIIGDSGQIDAQVMGWLEEAHRFALFK